MFYSYPYEVRELKATENRLERIYAAAKRGLKGDSLALASGMLPTEFRQLCNADPLAELAELKGRADGELEAATVIDQAIANGDAKMALEKAKHQYGWVAKQQLSIDVDQRISITAALEMAQSRVIDVLTHEVADTVPQQQLKQKAA